ncbi:hypothetical protein WCLP8_50001 [uncultured Gammaproteobacteria bacterium]
MNKFPGHLLYLSKSALIELDFNPPVAGQNLLARTTGQDVPGADLPLFQNTPDDSGNSIGAALWAAADLGDPLPPQLPGGANGVYPGVVWIMGFFDRPLEI